MARRGRAQVRGPVFIGGTGRCGTHAVASLVASGGEYALVPAELRVHTDLSALPSLASGESGRLDAARRLLTHWRRHPAPWDPGAPRGTHRVASRRRHLLAAARLLASSPGADPARPCRSYLNALLDPRAPAAGAWVEKTPDNCAATPFLRRLYPEMRLVHAIRDGRDVACSFMRVPWAPDEFEPALKLWERSLLAAHRGSSELPPDRVLALSLEDLVERDRELSYRRLLAFLGLADTETRRSFFERELTAERARIGRWRTDLPRSEHRRATALYGHSLERLRAAGVEPLPPATVALPSAHPKASAPGAGASPIDPWAATTAADERPDVRS